MAPACPQAVFLDRDGTINRERADYVKSWQEYEWLPGALTALAALAKLEVPILVVTESIGRGTWYTWHKRAAGNSCKSACGGLGRRWAT